MGIMKFRFVIKVSSCVGNPKQVCSGTISNANRILLSCTKGTFIFSIDHCTVLSNEQYSTINILYLTYVKLRCGRGVQGGYICFKFILLRIKTVRNKCYRKINYTVNKNRSFFGRGMRNHCFIVPVPTFSSRFVNGSFQPLKKKNIQVTVSFKCKIGTFVSLTLKINGFCHLLTDSSVNFR